MRIDITGGVEISKGVDHDLRDLTAAGAVKIG
jgi:hypothetical protein